MRVATGVVAPQSGQMRPSLNGGEIIGEMLSERLQKMQERPKHVHESGGITPQSRVRAAYRHLAEVLDVELPAGPERKRASENLETALLYSLESVSVPTAWSPKDQPEQAMGCGEALKVPDQNTTISEHKAVLRRRLRELHDEEAKIISELTGH